MQTPNLAELAFAHWQYEEELTRQKQIVTARKYHEGEQPTFLTDRARTFLGVEELEADFCMNVVRGVVEAVTERMMVAGFKCTDEASALWAWAMWQADRVDAKQNDVHEDAVRDGEEFVIVSWDDDEQRNRITPHNRYTDPEVEGTGEGCKATYANDDPNQPMLFASKRWTEKHAGETRQRLTLYYPDRIEKYVHTGLDWKPLDDATLIAEGDIVVSEEGDATLAPLWPKPWVDDDGHPLGIPVVHFRNPKMRPEAQDALPLQNAVNKALIDLLVAGDVTAFRVFVALGFLPTTDGEAPQADQSNWLDIEPGQTIGTTRSAQEADFKAIDGAPLDPLLNLLEKLVLWMAIITRTPVSRYQFSGAVASADTLKQQIESLLAKVGLRFTLFGDAWEDVMTIARRLQNHFGGGVDGELLDETAPFETLWQSSEKRDRLQELQGFQIEKDSLDVPLETLWAKAGYKPDEIAEMKKQRVAELKQRLQVALSDTVTDLTQ